MVDRPRIPLLLFSSALMMESCSDLLRARTYAPFRTELCGVGPVDARHRTRYLLESGVHPSAILWVGQAYWLPGNRFPEAPVWATEVKRRGKATLRPNLKLGTLFLQRSVLYTARLVTLSHVVSDRSTAQSLAEEMGVDACDTEAYSVIDVCIDNLLPCGILCAVRSHAGPRACESRLEQSSEGTIRIVPVLAELLEWLEKKTIPRMT